MYLFAFSGEIKPVKISNVEKAFQNKAFSKERKCFLYQADKR
jgi:hypothetical protein